MQYEFSRNSRKCAVSGREIPPGEVFYSELRETPTGLERRDYAKEHWNGPSSDSLGYWRGRVADPATPARSRQLSKESMFDLLVQLEGQESQNAKRLRYVLALLLVRKKALKLLRTEHVEGSDILVLQSSQSPATEHRVAETELTDEEIETAENDLAALFAATEE